MNNKISISVAIFATATFLLVSFTPLNESFKIHLCIYRNLTEMSEGGWFADNEGVYGQGVHFATPSAFSPEYAPLDQNASYGIWTGTPEGDKFSFSLNLDNPEFCGLTWADVEMKVYFNQGTLEVFPCTPTGNQTNCFVEPPTQMEWVAAKFKIDLMQQETPYVRGTNTMIGPVPTVFLIDEIKVVHDGKFCHQ